MDQRESIKEQLARAREILGYLLEQRAAYGIQYPVHLEIQREDTQRNIQRLEALLSGEEVSEKKQDLRLSSEERQLEYARRVLGHLQLQRAVFGLDVRCPPDLLLSLEEQELEVQRLEVLVENVRKKQADREWRELEVIEDNRLRRARRVLNILLEQKAGYGPSSAPVDLLREKADKERDIQKLEKEGEFSRDLSKRGFVEFPARLLLLSGNWRRRGSFLAIYRSVASWKSIKLSPKNNRDAR